MRFQPKIIRQYKWSATDGTRRIRSRVHTFDTIFDDEHKLRKCKSHLHIR